VRPGTRSPVFFDLTTMSSTYASVTRPINSPKARHMHHWKVVPAFLAQRASSGSSMRRTE
jgi:hypothetical protein